MRRLVWGAVLVAILSFMVWSKNPIDDTMNFIIGGSIPHSTASLGFWPMMTLAAGILLLIRRSLKNTRMKMIEASTQHNKVEQAAVEFKEQNSGETFDKSLRSVIAARSESTIEV